MWTPLNTTIRYYLLIDRPWNALKPEQPKPNGPPAAIESSEQVHGALRGIDQGEAQRCPKFVQWLRVFTTLEVRMKYQRRETANVGKRSTYKL